MDNLWWVRACLQWVLSCAALSSSDDIIRSAVLTRVVMVDMSQGLGSLWTSVRWSARWFTVTTAHSTSYTSMGWRQQRVPDTSVRGGDTRAPKARSSLCLFFLTFWLFVMIPPTSHSSNVSSQKFSRLNGSCELFDCHVQRAGIKAFVCSNVLFYIFIFIYFIFLKKSLLRCAPVWPCQP